MCHGSFDVVHPGHVRHLIYARGKADILIASLTADEHIEKAIYHPFVPEDIRALNLAALEPVDYVVIDRDSMPLKNLRILQPDYFTKGYEYLDGGLRLDSTYRCSGFIEASGRSTRRRVLGRYPSRGRTCPRLRVVRDR